MDITTKKNKSVIEIKEQLDSMGCKMNIVTVDGKPFTSIGYVSEADRDACLKAIQTAVEGSDNLYQAMGKLQTLCVLGEAEIDPDEEIEIDNDIYFISYKDRKAYLETQEVANLDDLNLPSVNRETLKALLIDRIRLSRV